MATVIMSGENALDLQTPLPPLRTFFWPRAISPSIMTATVF